jgi:hypothetical protein
MRIIINQTLMKIVATFILEYDFVQILQIFILFWRKYIILIGAWISN